MKIYFPLWLWLISLWTVNVNALDLRRYSLTHYTDENGLPQNSVKGIARDANGFVWIATEGGLVRFDGQKFFVFDKSKIKITSNRIYGFLPSPRQTSKPRGFVALTENHEYIEIADRGAARANEGLAKTYLSEYPPIARSRYGTEVMMSLPSVFMVGEPFLIPFYFKASNGYHYVWKSDQVETYLKEKRVAILSEKFKELFFLGPLPYGRLPSGQIVKITGGSMQPVKLGGLPDFEEPQVRIASQLFWDGVSAKAYLYYNRNLYSLTPSLDRTSLITTLILEDFDLEAFNIRCIYYDDKHSRIFLGSYTNGLFLIQKKVFSTLNSKMADFKNVFYAQLPPLFEQQHVKPGYYRPPALIANMIKNFVAKNPDGSFWMGSGRAISLFSSKSNKIEQTFNFQSEVRAIYRDHFGAVWVGGLSDSLFVSNQSNGTAPFNLVAKDKFGEILCMLRTSRDSLLFGTKKGLFKFVVHSGKVSPVDGLRNIQVRSLMQTGNDIWITTYGDGYYRLSHNKLTKFPMDKNEYLATSHCIVEDDQGYFWISTNKGLFQVSKADLEAYDGRSKELFYLYYDRHQGFNTNEFNGGCQPCGIKTDDGLVYFPSMDGVVRFDPGSVHPDLPDRPIFISQIKVDGNTVDSTFLTHLPRSFRELEIVLTTPYFGHQNNLNIFYSFQSPGQAPRWIRVPADFVIRKDNVGPGEFSLLVKKGGGFGKGNDIREIASVYIQPAWYETLLFKIVGVVAVLLIFWFVLKKRAESLVNEQKRKSIYRQYHLSSKLVTAISHDIQTPLHYIARCINLIQNNSVQTVNDPAYLSEIAKEAIDTIERTRARTSNLLNYIKSQTRTNTDSLMPSQSDLYELVNESFQLLSGIATFREVSVTNRVPPKTFVETDAQLVSIIIYNLLDNAVKFSDAEVMLTSQLIHGYQSLTIANTGHPLPEEIVSWLNKEYNSYDEWVLEFEYPDQNGLGLLIVKDLSVALGIRLRVTSTMQKGTCFILSF